MRLIKENKFLPGGLDGGLSLLVWKSCFEDLDERDHQERDCSGGRAEDMKGRSEKEQTGKPKRKQLGIDGHIKTNHQLSD